MGKFDIPVFQVVGMKNEDWLIEGNQILGVTLYMTTDGSPDGVTGCVFDKIFVSDKKLLNNGYDPKIGDFIQFTRNKHGKPDQIGLASEESLGVVTDVSDDKSQKKKLF